MYKKILIQRLYNETILLFIMCSVLSISYYKIPNMDFLQNIFHLCWWQSQNGEKNALTLKVKFTKMVLYHGLNMTLVKLKFATSISILYFFNFIQF